MTVLNVTIRPVVMGVTVSHSGTIGLTGPAGPAGPSGLVDVIILTDDETTGYQQLMALQGSWVPGQRYQFSFTTSTQLRTGEIHKGVPEDIVVTAASASTLEKRVTSTQYPDDIIEYSPLCSAIHQQEHGQITYRHEPLRDIYAYEDWRNSVTHLWLDGDGFYSIYIDPGDASPNDLFPMLNPNPNPDDGGNPFIYEHIHIAANNIQDDYPEQGDARPYYPNAIVFFKNAFKIDIGTGSDQQIFQDHISNAEIGCCVRVKCFGTVDCLVIEANASNNEFKGIVQQVHLLTGSQANIFDSDLDNVTILAGVENFHSEGGLTDCVVGSLAANSTITGNRSGQQIGMPVTTDDVLVINQLRSIRFGSLWPDIAGGASDMFVQYPDNVPPTETTIRIIDKIVIIPKPIAEPNTMIVMGIEEIVESEVRESVRVGTAIYFTTNVPAFDPAGETPAVYMLHSPIRIYANSADYYNANAAPVRYIDPVTGKWNGELTGTIPTSLAQLSDDATHRLVTDAEKTAWNAGGLGGFAALGSKSTNFDIDIATGTTQSFTMGASLQMGVKTPADAAKSQVLRVFVTNASTYTLTLKAAGTAGCSDVISSGGLTSSGDALVGSGAGTVDYYEFTWTGAKWLVSNIIYDVKA